MGGGIYHGYNILFWIPELDAPIFEYLQQLPLNQGGETPPWAYTEAMGLGYIDEATGLGYIDGLILRRG